MPRLSSTPSPPSSTPPPSPFLARLAHQALSAPYMKPSPHCFALSSSVWSPLPGQKSAARVKFEIPCFDSSTPYCLSPSCSDSFPFPGKKIPLSPLLPPPALDKESALFRPCSFYETPPPPPSPPLPLSHIGDFLPDQSIVETEIRADQVHRTAQGLELDEICGITILNRKVDIKSFQRPIEGKL